MTRSRITTAVVVTSVMVMSWAAGGALARPPRPELGAPVRMVVNTSSTTDTTTASSTSTTSIASSSTVAATPPAAPETTAPRPVDIAPTAPVNVPAGAVTVPQPVPPPAGFDDCDDDHDDYDADDDDDCDDIDDDQRDPLEGPDADDSDGDAAERGD